MSLGVSKTMVHHWIVDSTKRVDSNSLKSVLTEENKVAQLVMSLDSRDPQDPIDMILPVISLFSLRSNNSITGFYLKVKS